MMVNGRDRKISLRKEKAQAREEGKWSSWGVNLRDFELLVRM